MSAIAKPLGERLPSPGERAAANQLRRILASRGVDQEQTLRIIETSGQSAEIVLTPAISSLMIELLRHTGIVRASTFHIRATIFRMSAEVLVENLERKARYHLGMSERYPSII